MKQTEKFLLFRIRVHQDRKAFDEIYKTHVSPVRRFLYTKLPVGQVDDALMTTFYRLWDYLSKTGSVSNLSGLAFTIARGVVASYYRSRPKGEVFLDPALPDPPVIGKAIEAGAELALLKDHLDKMSEVHREVITLRFFEQLTTREIAVRLQRTENSIRVLLHRARKELKSFYEIND